MQYEVRPDASFGWVLGSWVFLVAYVVFIVNVAVDQQPVPLLPTVQTTHREWQLSEASNTTIDMCVDFAAHACDSSKLVHGLNMWQETTHVAFARVEATDLYRSCVESMLFEPTEVIPLVDDPGSADDWDETTHVRAVVSALLLGYSVNGVLARVSPMNGIHSLHVWHANSRFVHSVPADATCFAEYLTDHSSLLLHTVVHSPKSVCALLELATIAVTPVDYPLSCFDVVTMFGPQQLAAALDTPHRAVADALANRIAAHMALPDVAINVGVGKTVIGDTFDPALDIRTMWDARTTLRMGLVGALVNASLWDANPAMVNAFYDGELNAIFIPQGILWPPFVSECYSDELNLGTIGFIVAHELGHARDRRDNDTILLGQVVKDVMALSNASQLVVEVTAHEDLADYHAAKTLDAMVDLSVVTLLQFASLWCDTTASFSVDVHAPGWVRTNEVVGQLGRWRHRNC